MKIPYAMALENVHPEVFQQGHGVERSVSISTSHARLHFGFGSCWLSSSKVLQDNDDATSAQYCSLRLYMRVVLCTREDKGSRRDQKNYIRSKKDSLHLSEDTTAVILMDSRSRAICRRPGHDSSDPDHHLYRIGRRWPSVSSISAAHVSRAYA